jgi:inosine-uridine nucleoside N-ribohydrolase
MALGYLIQAQKENKIKINAVTFSHPSPYGAAAIRATFHYFGETPPPVGIMEGGYSLQDYYAMGVAEQFANEDDKVPAESAVTVLRKALTECEDKAVICAVGPLTNVGALLKSKPDAISPLNGVQLMAEKCERLVLMAGQFTPDEKGELPAEWNVKCDIPAAQAVADLSPVPIAWLPFETGLDMITGRPMLEKYGDSSPIALSFHLCPWGKNGRHSWDPATALYTVEGCGDFFVEHHGRVTVDENGITHQAENNSDNNCVIYPNIANETAQESKDKTAKYLDSAVMKLHENR